MRHLGYLIVLSRERALHGLLLAFGWIGAVALLGVSVSVARHFEYW